MDYEKTENDMVEEEPELTKQQEVKKRPFWRELLTTLIYIAAALVLALLLNRFVIQKVEVSMESMYDTLEPGDQLFVEKVTNYFSDPKRFDIVVFEAPSGSQLDDGKYWIKRVIGLPGDTIQMNEDGVYINGSKIEEDYVDGEMGDPGLLSEPITLKEDEYFLMGDNRAVSKDCREIGPISKEAMMGRVCLRIWPLNKLGTID